MLHLNGSTVAALSRGSFPALPQPSLLYKSQLTTTDTDGEQKHRKDKQRKRNTHRRKKTGLYTQRPGEDIRMSLSTHSVETFLIYFKSFLFFFPTVFSFSKNV